MNLRKIAMVFAAMTMVGSISAFADEKGPYAEYYFYVTGAFCDWNPTGVALDPEKGTAMVKVENWQNTKEGQPSGFKFKISKGDGDELYTYDPDNDMTNYDGYISFQTNANKENMMLPDLYVGKTVTFFLTYPAAGGKHNFSIYLGQVFPVDTDYGTLYFRQLGNKKEAELLIYPYGEARNQGYTWHTGYIGHETVVVPESVVNPYDNQTYQVSTIGYKALDKTDYKNIELPRSVTTLTNYAIQGKLDYLSIPGVKTIGNTGCNCSPTTLIMSDCLETVDYMGFPYEIGNYPSIIFPESLKTFATNAAMNGNFEYMEFPYDIKTVGNLLNAYVRDGKPGVVAFRAPALNISSSFTTPSEARPEPAYVYVPESNLEYYKAQYVGNSSRHADKVIPAWYYGKKREGYWGTLCLSHDVNLPSYNSEGVKFYTMAGLTQSGGKLKSISVDEIEEPILKAGEPYFYFYDGTTNNYYSDAPGTAARTFNGAKLLGLDYVDPEKEGATVGLEHNGLYGCLQATGNFSAEDGVYMLYDNVLYPAIASDENNEGSVCAKNRCYIKLTEVSAAPAAAPGVNRRTISIDEEASITNVFVDNTDSDDIYYDLTGRRVINPQKGIYIHNGKKVVIK